MSARLTGPETISIAPSEPALPARSRRWPTRKIGDEQPVLTVHGQLMRDLATRALAAGGGGLTKIGVASVQHGEGATTISRSLAVCLAENFGQRVVLVEANQRSPCLRAMCGLSPGAGLSDVLSGEASLEATLRISRAAGKMLVLPASATPSANVANLPGPSLRDLVAELFFYADALVFDLAPLLPYPDTNLIGRALDGVAVVMRAGKSTRAECTHAVEGLQGAGVPVLGAVLNREKSFLPRFLDRRG
jgi:Mrp family chromosome partitioning ATPase